MSRDSFESLEKPLLYADSDELVPRKQRQPLLWKWKFFAAVQVLLVVVYSVVFQSIRYQFCDCSQNSESTGFYSPAQAAITPQAKVIYANLNAENIFKGPPGPDTDAAWMGLFDYANIRITQDELRPTNRSSVLLNDDSGDAFGVLDVFHQLHCVKYIREFVHQDYYNLKHTEVPPLDHIDHCIDMLRQVIMCKADTSLMTFQWVDYKAMPEPSFELQHECRNWDSIVDWSKQRAIDITDLSILVHPTLGPAFIEEKWNRTKSAQNDL